MSLMTIRCRLVASEEARHAVWSLMAERNTPLTTELIARVNAHPDFETWCHRGRLPRTVVGPLCRELSLDPRFAGQPGFFYTSSVATVTQIYAAWFAKYTRVQRRVEGQRRWLAMAQSDDDLARGCGCAIEELRQRAAHILATLGGVDTAPQMPQHSGPKVRRAPGPVPALFSRYEDTTDPADRAAIVYLIKGGGAIRGTEEDPEQFARQRAAAEVRAQRALDQLTARRPSGRDLTDESYLAALHDAATTIPLDAMEARSWQDTLGRAPAALPFPVCIRTNEITHWTVDSRDRVVVQFVGLRPHTFAVYCDRRQVHWFRRFVEDEQTYAARKGDMSRALFALRTASLGWQAMQDAGPDAPWDAHRLTLSCTVETRLWTREGTDQVRAEKAAAAAATLATLEARDDLNTTQQGFARRLRSTLDRIDAPVQRPGRCLYQGRPDIVVGVSISAEIPAMVAVVDVAQRRALAYRSTRQLLGDQYRLLNRQGRQQRRHAHERHVARRAGAPDTASETRLGEYVDRLLGRAIVDVALAHRAGCIIVSDLSGIREAVEGRVRAGARDAVPGYREGQDAYGRRHRASAHRWSYARLFAAIRGAAGRAGVPVRQGRQPHGTMQERAFGLAVDDSSHDAAFDDRMQAEH